MDNGRVLVLGGTGFVGRNLATSLRSPKQIISTFRHRGQGNPGFTNSTYFDLFDPDSWGCIREIRPTVIVNCIAYGVVSEETDLSVMYETNYTQAIKVFEYAALHAPDALWVQLGTAYEYDTSAQDVTESTPCLPRSHYGISKLLFSSWLLQKARPGRAMVIRPFSMFGPGESASKLLPSLVLAQLLGRSVALTDGMQQRDSSYVKDFARFVDHLVSSPGQLPTVINFGSGRLISLRALGDLIAQALPAFNPVYWKWGAIPGRQGEPRAFRSTSDLAVHLGHHPTDHETAVRETVAAYLTQASTTSRI